MPDHDTHEAHSPEPKREGILIPKWLFGILTSVGTVIILGLGSWVIKTWNAPSDIDSLKQQVATIEKERNDEKLSYQKELSGIAQNLALVQKDVSELDKYNDEMKPLILRALQ